MGKTYAGGVDDASAIFANPAALALNDDFNFISMNGSLLTDVNYILIGAADDSPLGKFGLGYVNASVGSIPITTITGSGSTAAIVQTDSTNYSSSLICFSYGTRLGRFLRGKLDNVMLGGSLKYFLQGFTGGGTAMQNALGGGMDGDLGLIVEMNEWTKLGLSLNNCLPISFGGKFTWQKNDLVESIPMSTRAGMLYSNKPFRVYVDHESGGGENRPAVWHTGLEYMPNQILTLRGGMDQKPKAGETGIGAGNNMTFGVGLQYLGYTFDYAYHQFGELSDNSSHFFSIGYRGVEEAKKAQTTEEKKAPTIALTTVVPKPQLKTFIDLAADYWAKKPIEYLATLGIMGGYPDQAFKPDKELTRAELAAILIKSKEFTVETIEASSFKDVKAHDWSAPYVEIALQRQYLTGYPDGTFRPNNKVTRAESAVIFANYSGLYLKPKLQEKPYSDVDKGHWAASAIAADKMAGFFEYLSGGFGPKEQLTRAEAAEILSKTPTVKDKIKKLISGEK